MAAPRNLAGANPNGCFAQVERQLWVEISHSMRRCPLLSKKFDQDSNPRICRNRQMAAANTRGVPHGLMRRGRAPWKIASDTVALRPSGTASAVHRAQAFATDGAPKRPPACRARSTSHQSRGPSRRSKYCKSCNISHNAISCCLTTLCL
jgi:hypothetical protein